MDRKILKSRAKTILKKHYGKLLFVCFFIGITMSFNVQWNSPYTTKNYENALVFPIGEGKDCYYMLPYLSSLVLEFMGRGAYLLFSYRMLIALIAILIFFNVFVLSVIVVGANKILLDVSQDREMNLSDLFWGFQEGRYMHCVDVMFFLKLKILLWSLVFLIPGIIKQYEYAFVPYLLVEHPDWDSSVIFKESTKMTEGRKMDLFVLSLSFMGFYLIPIFTIGFLAFFVEPYYQTTKTLAYRFFQDEDNKKKDTEITDVSMEEVVVEEKL